MRREFPSSTQNPHTLTLKEEMKIIEMINWSKQKAVYVWQLESGMHKPFSLLGDGSLVTMVHWRPTRRDACSNVAWRKRFFVHHSMEREADGRFWMPAFARSSTVPGTNSKFKDHDLIESSRPATCSCGFRC